MMPSLVSEFLPDLTDTPPPVPIHPSVYVDNPCNCDDR